MPMVNSGQAKKPLDEWTKNLRDARFFGSINRVKRAHSWLVPYREYEILVFKVEYLSVFEVANVPA